jgi:hypothetical protein
MYGELYPSRRILEVPSQPSDGTCNAECVISHRSYAYTSDILRYLTFSVVVGKFSYCTFFQTATNVNYPPVACNIDANVQCTH